MSSLGDIRSRGDRTFIAALEFAQQTDTVLDVHSSNRDPTRMNNIMMKIRPLYDRIVVKRIDEPETSRNGIVIPDSAQEKSQEGEVMAMGRGKALESGELTPLDVKVGDRILFGKYSGSEVTLDNTEYIIMREEDVLGIFDSTTKPAKAA